MKKYWLFFVLIALVIPVFGQLTAFEEDFEPTAGSLWYTVASDPATANWYITTDDYWSSSHSLFHDDFTLSSPCQDWAIAGPISLMGDNPEISFYDCTYYGTYYYLYHGFWISTTDPAADPYSIMTEVDEVDDWSSSWTERTYDLSSYAGAGDQIWIAFMYAEDWDTEWYIDDITITTDEPASGYLAGNAMLSGEADHGGITITASPTFTATSASPSGDYIIDDIYVGTFDVVATKSGFLPDTAFGVVIVEAETTWVDFTLDVAPYGFIRGYADLTDTPGADEGIEVYLSRGGYTTTTAADGSFELPDIARGEGYVVYAEYPTYVMTSSMPLTVNPMDTLDVDTLYLEPTLDATEFDFDSDDGGFIADPVSGGWEWGAPGTEVTAYSSPNVWGTVLGDYYGTNYADWSLTIDFAASGIGVYDRMVFHHWYNIESGFDGGVVQISTDGGATWTNVEPTPGYDDDISTSFSSPIAGEWAYTGTSGTWIEATLDLTAYTGITHIRFRFASDSSLNSYYGWYIDDVLFSSDIPYEENFNSVDGYVYNQETYEPVAGAMVYGPAGLEVMTDSEGYFTFESMPIGVQTLTAAKTGFFPNTVEVAVNQYVPSTAMIPVHPVTYSPGSPVVSHIPYDHADDVPTITFCNPTDEAIDYYFGPWESGLGGLLRETDLRADDNPFAKVDKFAPGYDVNAQINPDAMYTTDDALLRTMEMGDITEIIPVAGGIDIAWGLGLLGLWETDRFWVSDVTGAETGYVREYLRDGTYTGRYFDFMAAFPDIAFIGDMTWDGAYVWMVAVGGSNALYKLDPETFTVVDSIVDPTPGSGWGAVSQRGVAYDHVEDVFYVGGWNSDRIWKIKGESWDVPGDEIDSGISAPDCAGIGFHANRRTVWFAQNNVDNIIVEVDYETGLVLNQLPLDRIDYSLSGLEVDGEGQVWVVDQNTNEVLILDSGFGLLPDGIFFDPQSGTLAPGECVTINIHTNGHTAHVGRYEFDGYLFVDDRVDPITIPMVVEVAPTINNGWNIVSVPVDAVPNDPWVQLHDDIDPFDVASSGQLYAWDPILGRYVLPDGFERGRGYYLWGWHDDTKFDVWGAEYTTDMIMSLNSYPDATMPNWHVIGNPFNRRIDWDDVTSDPAFTGIDPTAWFFSTAEGWMTYTPGLPPMGVTNEFDPWTGWWIKVTNAAGGTIPFRNNYTYESLLKTKKKSDTALEDFALRITVGANTASGWKIDKYNYMATSVLATDVLDAVDHTEMTMSPMGSELVSASFVAGATSLKDDIKATFEPNQTKTWTMSITDLEPGTPVKLSWPIERPIDAADGSDGLENISEAFTFTMVHPVTGEDVDMREIDEITFIYTAPVTVEFRVTTMILATDENALPKEFALSQNFPNPFNAVTAFKVAVPEDAEVTLEVYNIMGQKVRTLINNESMNAGYHNVIWDGMTDKGTKTSSGVYLYKMSTSKFEDTKKAILVK